MTLEGLFYKAYVLSIENRNKRIILRSIEEMDQTQQLVNLRDDIAKINNMLSR